MRIRFAAMLVMAAGLAAAADKADAVKAAEKSWAVASVAGDAATLGKVLADDLVYTHSTGELDTKASFIDNLKGTRKYHKLDHESMNVRVYGNTAVLTGTVQVATSMKGGPVSPAHLRILHVYVFEGGRWQMVAHQSLRLPN